tara:strand:+ start:1104 stop:1241 length:138 start_codon:yes stop_codon:yes gene_type:complete
MNPSKNAVSKKINKKKTSQGNGTFSKKSHNKQSKGHKKSYRGQGK